MTVKQLKNSDCQLVNSRKEKLQVNFIKQKITFFDKLVPTPLRGSLNLTVPPCIAFRILQVKEQIQINEINCVVDNFRRDLS